MIYLDSSILLEMYLGQPRASVAQELVGLPGAKVSSWVLAVEVPVVLRRVLSLSLTNQTLLRPALERFDADVGCLSLHHQPLEIAARIRSDARFARCRALDAIHLASALLLREETGELLQLATFDAGLRIGASLFDLPLLPG